MQWLIYGGLAYTIGVGIDVQHEPNIWPGVIGYHELFHVLVVVGSFCHFVFIWEYVLPTVLNACAEPMSASGENKSEMNRLPDGSELLHVSLIPMATFSAHTASPPPPSRTPAG